MNTQTHRPEHHEHHKPWIVIRNGGSNGLWRSLATGTGGLVIGLLLAWFTAFTERGVKQRDMEDYVERHSPYIADKQLIADHQVTMAKDLGKISGTQEELIQRAVRIEDKATEQASELGELRTKVELIGKLLQEREARRR